MTTGKPVPGGMLGIDVSHWQGVINWPEVAQGLVQGEKVRFCYAKASTGMTGRDKRWVQNAVGGTAAGIPFGGYHWIRPGFNDPIKEADNFCDALQAALDAGAKLGLAPMVDLEEKPAAGSTAQSTISYLDACCERIQQRTGRRPIVYTGSSYAASYLNRQKLRWPVWIAQYNKPSCAYPTETTNPNTLNDTTKNWAVWQYCSKGSVPGIGGNVDLNVLRPGQEDAIFEGGSGVGSGALLAVALAGAAFWAFRKS